MADHPTDSTAMSQPLTNSPTLSRPQLDLSACQTPHVSAEIPHAVADSSVSVPDPSHGRSSQSQPLSDQKLTYVPTAVSSGAAARTNIPVDQSVFESQAKHPLPEKGNADAVLAPTAKPTPGNKNAETPSLNSNIPAQKIREFPSLPDQQKEAEHCTKEKDSETALNLGSGPPPGSLVQQLSDSLSTISKKVPTANDQSTSSPIDQSTHHSTVSRGKNDSSKTISQDPSPQTFSPPIDVSEALATTSPMDVDIAMSKADVQSTEEDQHTSGPQKIAPQSKVEGTERFEKRPLEETRTAVPEDRQDGAGTKEEPGTKRQKVDEDSREKAKTGTNSDASPEGLTDWKPQGRAPAETEKTEGSIAGGQRDAIHSKHVLRAAPTSVVSMLPMLRSSLVGVDSDAAGGRKTTTTRGPERNSAKRKLKPETADDVRPKKRKTVSWAPQEKLVDVQHIDTRLELIRSWDPEFEITLPFGPATLQMFKSMSEEQRKTEGHDQGVGRDGGGVSVLGGGCMTAFEAARKKEHDMELDRAQKAREELNKKLNMMGAVHTWRKPTAIVLPAECRIDADGIEQYDLGDEAGSSMTRDANAQTPPSPLMGFNTGRDSMEPNDSRVHLFPLSDASVETGESAVSSTENTMRVDQEGEREGLEEKYYRGNGGKFDSGRNNGVVRTGHHGNEMGEFGMGRHEAHMGDGSGGFKGGIAGMGGVGGLGGMGGLPGKDRTHLPPHAVQHLLSALQSTGLLSQTNNGHQDRNMGGKYGGGGMGNDRGVPGEPYRPRQDSGGPGMDVTMNDANANGGRYGEDERRRMHGPENGMGMVNGAVGPPGPGPAPVAPPPPPPPPGAILGHGGPLGGGFHQGVQGGMMDGFPFPMPPMPPPPMGMHPNLMALGMGLGMPGMGIRMPFNMGGAGMGMGGGKGGGKSGAGRGREAETITRPKMKGPKQRKKCKYFGTKQGCRDGSSCMFAHIS